MLVLLDDSLASDRALQPDTLHQSDASAGSGTALVLRGLIQMSTIWRKVVLQVHILADV